MRNKFLSFLFLFTSIALVAVGSARADHLADELGARITRVPEFKFIQDEAKKLGVRVYLFGGTAAGYAHYVNWDLKREGGDPRFQKDRFDYDYTNIFRSTQDLDIVIDGTTEQAQQLQVDLQRVYPHLQGSKTAWEVTLLREDLGEKPSKFSPDFQNQHNDSNSTGLIEITEPQHGERRVRDVRDWNSPDPFFLKDVRDGKIHFYFSPKHESTRFFREGRNPPIFSAIRVLTKAFQYETELRPEDLKLIEKIVRDFNPTRDLQSPYAKTWIEKNGKKLIQNAVNIEYAVDVLDRIGLRKKLAPIQNNANEMDSLAWWMDKEPLRTKALGTGKGKTAAQLGIDIVAHETNSFLAYESITRAHTGDPNVLISRNDHVGEAAIFGDGFYTLQGKEGARGSGLTIRFHLAPNAREGTDFTTPSGSMVLVHNKAALRVIPESLSISPVNYFKMLALGETMDHSDLGIWEKLKRRIDAQFGNISHEEEAEIHQIIREAAQNPRRLGAKAVLQDYFGRSFSLKTPELLKLAFEHVDQDPKFGSSLITSLPLWKDFFNTHPEVYLGFLEKVIFKLPNETAKNTIRSWFADPTSVQHPDFLKALLNHSEKAPDLVGDIFGMAHWQVFRGAHPELTDRVIAQAVRNRALLSSEKLLDKWFKGAASLRSVVWMDEITKNISVNIGLANRLLVEPVLKDYWEKHPDQVSRVFEDGIPNEDVIGYALREKDPVLRARWLRAAIKTGDTHADYKLVQEVLTEGERRALLQKSVAGAAQDPKWLNDRKGIATRLLEKLKSEGADALTSEEKAKLFRFASEELGEFNRFFNFEFRAQASSLDSSSWLQDWFSQPLSAQDPTALRRKIANGSSLERENIIKVLSFDHWRQSPDLPKIVNELFAKRDSQGLLAAVIQMPQAVQHPEWVVPYLSQRNVIAALKAPHWAAHGDWVQELVEMDDEEVDQALIGHVLGQSQWAKDSRWTKWVDTLLKRNFPRAESLFRGVLRLPEAAAHPEWVRPFITDPEGRSDEWLIQEVLKIPAWTQDPEWPDWAEAILKRGKIGPARIWPEYVAAFPDRAAKFLEHSIGDASVSSETQAKILIQGKDRYYPDRAHFFSTFDTIYKNADSSNRYKLLMILFEKSNMVHGDEIGASIAEVSRMPNVSADIDHLAWTATHFKATEMQRAFLAQPEKLQALLQFGKDAVASNDLQKARIWVKLSEVLPQLRQLPEESKLTQAALDLRANEHGNDDDFLIAMKSHHEWAREKGIEEFVDRHLLALNRSADLDQMKSLMSKHPWTIHPRSPVWFKAANLYYREEREKVLHKSLSEVCERIFGSFFGK